MHNTADYDLALGFWIQDVPYSLDNLKRSYYDFGVQDVNETLVSLKECDGNLFGISKVQGNRMNGRDFPGILASTIQKPEKLITKGRLTGKCFSYGWYQIEIVQRIE